MKVNRQWVSPPLFSVICIQSLRISSSRGGELGSWVMDCPLRYLETLLDRHSVRIL